MDSISIEILDDGTIKVTTEGIQDANHISADTLLSQMETLLGGSVTKIKNPEKHKHQHLINAAKAH